MTYTTRDMGESHTRQAAQAVTRIIPRCSDGPWRRVACWDGFPIKRPFQLSPLVLFGPHLAANGRARVQHELLLSLSRAPPNESKLLT